MLEEIYFTVNRLGREDMNSLLEHTHSKEQELEKKHLVEIKPAEEQQSLSELSREPSTQKYPQLHRANIESKHSIKWREESKAQYRMCQGATAVKDSEVYFINWNGATCTFGLTNKKWSEAPKYPYKYPTLVVINSLVTGIGGCIDMCKVDTYTNKLLSLSKHDWVEIFPPMPTKRKDATAISTEQHVVVAGGMCGPFINASIATVEVMDTRKLTWSTVASLPHHYTGASGAICEEQLFILGGFDCKGETKSVLTCSLEELLLSSSSSLSSSVWMRAANAPAYQSSCASLDGELLVVGGSDKEGKTTAAIHKYNPITNSWDIIGKMPTSRCSCLISVLSSNEMMVVGGEVQWNRTVDKVEIASFNYYF